MILSIKQIHFILYKTQWWSSFHWISRICDALRDIEGGKKLLLPFLSCFCSTFLVTPNLELYVPANYMHKYNFLLIVIWNLFFSFLVGKNHSPSRAFVSGKMLMVLAILVDSWNRKRISSDPRGNLF